MPGVSVEQASKRIERQQDISSWQPYDTSELSARAKKTYQKRKAAIEMYFTGATPVEEIAKQHGLSPGQLIKLARRCLRLHEDGQPWGYRALAPRVVMRSHTDEAASASENETASGAEETRAEPDDSATIADMTNAYACEPAADIITDEAEADTEKRIALPSDRLILIPETPLPEVALDFEAAECVGADLSRPVAEEQILSSANLPTPGRDKSTATHPEAEAPLETESHAEESGEADVDAETPTVPLAESVETDSSRPAEETGAINCAATSSEPVLPAPIDEESPATEEVAPLEPLVSQEEELPGGSAYRVTMRRTAQRRLIQKRKGRVTQQTRHRRRVWRVASVVALLALLIVVAMPLGTGLAAYSAYSNVSALAHDALNNLLAAKSLLHFSKSDPTAALNAANLRQAQSDFETSENDFIQLQQLVNRPDIQSAVTQFAPQYANKLGMAQRLVQVGLDVTRMGDELAGVGLIAANILHSSPLASGSNKPLISPTDIAAVEAGITHALYYISDVQLQMSQVSVNELPISASQKAEFSSLMGQLPAIQSQITQVQSDVGMVAWLLGVGQQRRFLVQTMDTAELRPGGGFTGDYGVLQINNGRMSPFTLTDVTLIDYAENGTAIGRTAPPGYSWMNFGNWGVRDSNLSGDFPTTARMTMQLFEQEGGGPVDGDIALTPAVIAHVMYATGSVKMPGYNITVTPQNLEYWIHYYQQNPIAISQEKQISGNYSHSGRKAFTGELGQLVLERVRHLSPSKLIGVFKQALKDIQSRDLEIYFNDPSAENWLVQHGYSGSMNTFSHVDGFNVTQANISISKASQYVHTTLEDDVTLDASGGATHNLTITLNYQQTGPVYGYDTYADYIRVYAPANATLLGGDGFDTGHALCTPKGTSNIPPGSAPGTGKPPVNSSNCSQYNTMFPSAARYCPNNDYALGERGYIAGKGYTLWPYDALGGPTELTSDLPGRAMWGGLTETPKNCISYITLSWYVPHAVKKVHGQPTYTILFQKQSGLSPTLILNINAAAIRGLKSFSYNHTINGDRQFTLQPPRKK
ncbi:MAG: DUF4012 domain-containing protein [Ktedonobacteraceae bacterium]